MEMATAVPSCRLLEKPRICGENSREVWADYRNGFAVASKRADDVLGKPLTDI